MLWKGRESLPCTAAEVYSQLTQSCRILRDCISMECIWSHFSAKPRFRLHTWEVAHPCLVVHEANAKQDSCTPLQPPETQRGGSLICPPKACVPSSWVIPWSLSHCLAYLPFQVALGPSVDLSGMLKKFHGHTKCLEAFGWKGQEMQSFKLNYFISS